MRIKTALAIYALIMSPLAAPAVSLNYIKIEYKGLSRVVSCPNGACVVDGLAAGRYTVRICDATGKVIASDTTLYYSVVAPRDAASGSPTGKRMHKPLRIYTELGKGTAPSDTISIDEPGVHVAIGVDAAAADAAVAVINTSRSNIKQ